MSRTIKIILFMVFTSAILFSCGPKPYYKTAEGKKKLKHYNSIQFDREQHRPSKRRN